MSKHQVFYLHRFCVLFLFLYSPHHYWCLLYVSPAINVLNKNSKYCLTQWVADLKCQAKVKCSEYSWPIAILGLSSPTVVYTLHKRSPFLLPLVLDLVSRHNVVVWEGTLDQLYFLTRMSSEIPFPFKEINIKFHLYMQTDSSLKKCCRLYTFSSISPLSSSS